MRGGATVRIARDLRARLSAALRSKSGRATAWAHEVLVLERPAVAPPPDPDGLLHDLLALRLVVRHGDRVEPRARVDVVGELLVASDLRHSRRAVDFVVGPGPASFTLARHVRPHGPGRLLDLGTGSGIQGLLLAGPRTEVTAIDVNPRALAFTAFNAGLNVRHRIRPILGDFLAADPDRSLDGRFETVVANPPFVLAPTLDVLYRDRPLPGDEVGARTVERVARALAPGGRGYVLCNWIDRDTGWAEPARTWVAETGLAGAATRLATLDARGYAAAWTRDLPGASRPAAIAAWTQALEAEHIDRIHIGVIEIARLDGRPGTARPAFAIVDRVTA